MAKAADLEAFYGKSIPDIIAPRLRVLFCGINPSLTSAARNCHFARPGNRFWPALHLSGFTPRQIPPAENRELLDYGLGVTNLVARATRNAGELAVDEYRAGVAALARKCQRYQPAFVAVLGIGAYRAGFQEPAAKLGPQPRQLGGARLYVLPNPSGLNAHFTPAQLGRLFAHFREHVEQTLREAE
jgi:TDG/mug DNA glycosylase family protein